MGNTLDMLYEDNPWMPIMVANLGNVKTLAVYETGMAYVRLKLPGLSVVTTSHTHLKTMQRMYADMIVSHFSDVPFLPEWF